MPPTGCLRQSQDEQQPDGADCSAEDDADQAGAEVKPRPRQQPAADKGTDDTDDDIANQTAGASFDDHACNRTRNGSDQQPLG